jgi:hypothetical protein
MPFGPPSGIKAGNLSPATPTPFDATALKTQLQNIGLSCAQINEQNLNQYISQVNSQLPIGAVQSFAIKAPSTNIGPATAAAQVGGMMALAAAVPPLEDSATGNWTINAEGDGYGPQLEVIQYPDHFNWLYANRATNGFTGVIDNPPAYTGNYPNAEAIQNLFVNVGITASATLVKGIDQDAMRATLSNAIQPLADANLDDYNVSDSRTIFLVDNYNPSTQIADGLGVLFISWTLTISDYKRKTKDGGDTHPTSLTINAGSILYSDPSTLCADYNSVLKQFNIDPATAPTCS